MNKKSYIFTGYLGSGKTTSMIKVIEDFFKNKKVTFIVNEFGEVSIDGKVISGSIANANIVEINEGCVCCVLYDELNKVLSDLQSKYDFEYLFIETSGLSEPFPIYSTLISLGFEVESIICLVDSLNYKKYADDDLFRYQIGASNVIVLNKIDLIGVKRAQEVKEEIVSIKEKYNLKNFLTGEYLIPKYEIVETSYGELPEYIFKDLKIPLLSKEQLDHFQDKHSHQSYIQEVFNYPVNALYCQQFEKLVGSFPKNLVRAKGILKFKDVDIPLLFNYSYGNYTFQEYPEDIEQSVVVAIYKNELKVV
ncbi:MAG: GTP-binding protein [Hydrogenothermaceae bacterium]|nr:GTP-binding protein [Hydrogenothermaceae bacterium]